MQLNRIPTIQSLPLAGKRVFLRLDLNVPQNADQTVADDSRLNACLPTLQALLKAGAIVAAASHLGRPKKGVEAKFSLAPVAARLGALLGKPVRFVGDCVGAPVRQAMAAMRGGELAVLENTRFHPQEEKNDADFSAQLAEGFEVYINDAFGTLHRAHASTAGMASHFRLKAMGLLVEQELKALRPLTENPKTPFALILGGAKVSDKLGILEHLLPRLEGHGRLLIGGGMAFTFLKARGQQIGASLLDNERLTTVQGIMETAQRCGISLHLPVDFRIADGDGARVVHSLGAGEMGLDIGPQTEAQFAAALQGAATVFWNGPLGMFEKAPFMHGTLAVAQAVAALPAHKVIGGGDTLAAFTKLNLVDRLSHASTGGGATLEFLEGKELPGLTALMA